MDKPFTYLVVTEFPTYLPIHIGLSSRTTGYQGESKY
jgi:hypothetical protein